MRSPYYLLHYTAATYCVLALVFKGVKSYSLLFLPIYLKLSNQKIFIFNIIDEIKLRSKKRANGADAIFENKLHNKIRNALLGVKTRIYLHLKRFTNESHLTSSQKLRRASQQ